jgi:hypothetical protein
MLVPLGLALRSASANGCGGVMKADKNPGGPATKIRPAKVAKLSDSE